MTDSPLPPTGTRDVHTVRRGARLPAGGAAAVLDRVLGRRSPDRPDCDQNDADDSEVLERTSA